MTTAKHRKSSSASRGRLSTSTKNAPAAAAVEEEDVYTIDKIIDYTEDSKDGPKWRIRWKNYTAADDTWEPAENIMTDDKKVHSDMDRLQREYHQKNQSSTPASKKAAAASPAAAAGRKKGEVEVIKSRGKSSRKSIEKKNNMRVAHIRRYPDRDDDFQCVLVDGEGDTQILPVSEARGKYYNELIDYLLKRVKFLENNN